MTRLVHVVLCLLILSASSALAQNHAAGDTTNAALAERLAAAAQETLRGRDAGEPSWRASAALLRAATRLAPTEPRFARLLAEAVARLGDDQASIDALTAYRTLVPSDESAQVEQIDLFLRGMETADARVNYLRAVSASPDVVAPVRAHAAFRLAEVLGERLQMTESDEALAEALKLDPLNLDALAMSYARLPADAPPERRVAALLALLRSNPAQAQIAAVLARELANVGLFKGSLQWHNTAFGVYQRTGTPPSAQEVVDYAAQAYINGEVKGAEALLSSLLQAQPDHIEAWLLRLIVARSTGDKEAAERVRKQTATAITNLLAEIRKAAGEEAATTQPLDPPADAQWPDPAAMLERVKSAAADKPQLIEAFADAALSAAWFKVYFQEKPEEAQPWINALRELLVEGSQTIARLEGWAFLIGNKPEEARVKLSAAAEADPLAALGMLRVSPAEGENQPAAEDAARQLLASNGSGLTGATIAEALAFRGIKPAAGEAAAPVTAELAKFPAPFTRILDAPGAFYALRVEPVKVSHQFGEPILLRITIQNNSEFDLTVGPDGIIRSDLWIDGQLRGIGDKPFPGVAFDRLGGPLVLAAKKAMSQVVRVSQGELSAFLATNPNASLQLAFTAMTNPTSIGGNVEPGPAGQRITSARLVERRGTPNNAAVVEQRALEALSTGSATEKIRQLELVTTFAQLLSAEKPEEPTKAAIAALRDVLRRGTADADPHVRAYAMYSSATLAPDAELPAAIAALAAEPGWSARLLAVLLSHARGGAGRDPVARLAESDPDDLVKQYAAAVSAIPTTQETTQPAVPPTPQ